MEEHLDQGLILDESSLAWQRYDEIMRAMDRVEDQYDLSAGMERFNPQKFKRDLTVFRIGHFASRIVELGPKIELPTGSILHLLDDVVYSEHSDVPRLEENVFVQHESFKKYIYHVRDFDLAEGPIALDEKYIYRTAGLPRVLMSFRSNYGNKYKYINTLAEVPTRKEALVIINHNPLFRVTLYGRLQYFRKIQLILASVLNTVHRLTPLNKQQFIMIPWGTEIFEKSLFVRSRKALTPFTVRYPESFHYIVMMHLVNFMWNDAQTSFLDKLPEEDLAQINLVLNCANKYVFYNLADLKAMNAKNAAHMRFVNQLNMLSVLGRPEVNKDRLSDHFTKVDITDDEDTVSAAYEVKSERQQDTTDTPVNPEPERLTPEDLGENSSAAEVEEENRVERVITHAAKVIPAAVKQAATKVSTALPRANTVETRLVAGATSRVAVTAKTTNSSNPTSTDKSSDKQDVTRRYLQEQETLADEFIMKQPTLTPRQKERCKVLARKYRDLELHGVKLSKILSTQDDIELDDAPLTEEVLGIEAPDKAALTYAPRAYDNSYLKKTSDKHFVGAINSFQRNGVFLVGIKENKVVSELNNYTEYTLQYEDWEGKKSSIKVKLPTVNREGKVVIDGIPKVLRKQRVTLPIVKTSDTTVSLSSNYNKTQVIRNTTKAHNYFSYIDGLVNSPKSKAVVIYGNCVIRDVPLAYEYTQLADKYKSLEWDDWKLWFDYKNRAEHFDGTEERLAKLEAQYGTYFGRQGKVNLFIDEQNEVHAITTTGSDDPEFPYRSIFDICKTSLNEGAKYDKPLTEWVSIKILDKMLPVMFLLSYRYGLRHTLDYLGVDYTITEGRSKVILGESGVAGNESIGSSRYPAPEQLTDRLLQTVGHKVKLQMKALYHFDVDNVELKVSRQNYYDNGKPCNTDAYNAWAGCYVRATNTVYINEQFAAVMRNWFAEQVVYYDNYVRFLYWMVAHELTHSCYGNAKYADTFNKVEAAAKNKNFTTVYLEGIAKTAPNYREELCCEYVASQMKQITVGNESFGTTIPGMEGLSLAELGQLAGNLISPVNSFMEAIKFSTPFSYIWTTGSEVDTVGKRIRFKSIELWDFDAGRFMRRQRAGRLDEVAGKWYPIKLPKQLDLLHHASFGDIVQIADIESMIPDFFKEVRALVKRRGYAVINHDLRFTFRSGIHHRLVALAEKSGTRITRNKVFIPEEFHGNKSIIGTASFGAGIDNILDVGGVVDDKYFGTDWIKFKNDDEEAGTEDANERRYVPKPGDVPIKFADRVLWINRYPLAKSLIVCGLGGMNTEDYEMAAFESPDIYYQVLMDQGLSINYLKGIDSFFDLFIDNMTYSVLESMHEPTNVRDLLIRCAVLLSTMDHRPPSSRANHRIRGYEQFNAVVYNEMARQFAAYQSRRGAGNKFSVNPNAIYLRVVSNASLVPSECPNPLQDMKEQAAMTYAGAGGRTSESFVVEDRKFSHDDIGVVSEATVDNGKVGINAQLAFNAGIVDTEGTLAQPDELSAGNVLSATAVMFPFATRDDSKRCNFISVQSAHYVPAVTTEPFRVRTGYERIAAHRVGRTYAGIAQQDGKVTNIDEKAQLIEVTYENGDTDIFPYGEKYTEFQGYCVTNEILSVVKLGDKLKKGDVITYNKGFFTYDPRSRQLDLAIGLNANVAMIEMDTNLEDASEISPDLAARITIKPTQQRFVTLDRKSLVHKCVSVGDEVKSADTLMVFEEDTSLDNSDNFKVNEETMKLLSDLNSRIPTAKFNGRIVKIEAHYACEISEMHPSLAAIVRNAIAGQNRASKLASKTDSAEEYPPSEPLPVGTKYKGTLFTEDTVMLTFYIQELEHTTIGDKIVVGLQLKNTISSVMPKPYYTEEGVPVDVMFSASAANRRITTSPSLIGISNRILEKMEKDIVAMYFG